MSAGFQLWTEDELENLSPDEYKEKDIPFITSFACDVHRRSTMEDKALVSILYPGVCLCAVLDGHGGQGAVNHFTNILPKNLGERLSKITSPTKEQVKETVESVFLDADEQFYNQDTDTSGTTFTGVLIFYGEQKKTIYVINLGDSRTVVCSSKENQNSVIFASKDQKPTDELERERIQKAGGYVSWGRVDGMLAVSRALGDNDFKGFVKYKGREAKVSPVPSVTEIPFPEDLRIIMASDGLYDTIYGNYGTILDKLKRKDLCPFLLDLAKRGTSDNITIMMIDLS